jgi:hypothetical protein
MEKEHGKNNAQSLFGVHLIPQIPPSKPEA